MPSPISNQHCIKIKNQITAHFVQMCFFMLQIILISLKYPYFSSKIPNKVLLKITVTENTLFNVSSSHLLVHTRVSYFEEYSTCLYLFSRMACFLIHVSLNTSKLVLIKKFWVFNKNRIAVVINLVWFYMSEKTLLKYL